MTYRNPKYLAFVRSLPCAMCGSMIDVQAHHIKSIGNLSGVGLKANDQYTMSLCVDCHCRMHTTPELWPDQWEYVARALGRAVEEGFFGGKR